MSDADETRGGEGAPLGRALPPTDELESTVVYNEVTKVSKKMTNKPMHAPIRYAANALLVRDRGVTLDEWLGARGGVPTSVVVGQLNTDTDGVVLVDKRTIERWMAQASA